jgi:hypothetical protein
MLRETHLFLIWLSGNCVFICNVGSISFVLRNFGISMEFSASCFWYLVKKKFV